MTLHNRHVFLKPFLKFLKDAEDDALTQIKIHRISVRFWLGNMVLATVVFFGFPGFWAEASVFYLVLLSLYANFATDYGALIASEAALSAGKAAEKVLKEETNE